MSARLEIHRLAARILRVPINRPVERNAVAPATRAALPRAFPTAQQFFQCGAIDLEAGVPLTTAEAAGA